MAHLTKAETDHNIKMNDDDPRSSQTGPPLLSPQKAVDAGIVSKILLYIYMCVCSELLEN